MLNIKKYSNGRFFDTVKKKYIKSETLAELIKKGEEIQVTLTKTGKDITEEVIAQFTKQENKKTKKQKKEIPFLATDKLMKWVGEVIDTKIEQVMDVVKLPTREQVANLDKNIKELNKKIDALTVSQNKTMEKKAVAPEKTVHASGTADPKETVTGGKTEMKPTPGPKKSEI